MRICRCYGWTLEYVLSLTCPQFFRLSSAVRRVRLDETIDTVYAGYTAGKYGGKASDGLFKGRGSFTLAYGEDDGPTVPKYTPEQLKKTQERLDRYLKQKQLEAEEQAGCHSISEK